MLTALRRRGTAGATYGRVAKFVAVYLKSMIVVGPHSESRLASVIHPPIDRVLLENLCSSRAALDRLARWRGVAWTRLDKRRYYMLIADLRSLLRASEPFWMLERYWTFSIRGESGGGSPAD